MLVKLLRPTIGDNVVKTKTYSNKGDDLITGLNQYKKKKGINIEAVDNLIQIIADHKKDWIGKTITLRTVDFLKTVYSNNLIFHQDFTALSLALTAPKQIFLASEDPKNPIKEYGEKIGQYVKFCWKFNPPETK